MNPACAPVVEVSKLVRRHGTLAAVQGISLEVHRGELFGLIGPDGAGKTTTIRVLLGLLRPDAGQVKVCGLNPAASGEALSGRVGYLSQRFSLYGDLSVDENIAFFARIHGVQGWRGRRDELLDRLRMTPFRKRAAERLSGGMKQKLALACTLIHRPELLLLDEPTTGVDPVSRRDFWRMLTSLQREGLTILLTTPYLDEAERCHRVALMDGGRLLVTDTPEALRAGFGRTIIEILAAPRAAALERLGRESSVEDLQTFGERLHVSISPPGARDPEGPADGRWNPERESDRLAGILRQAGIEVTSSRPTPPTLEDVFIARLRDGAPEARREERAS